MSIFVRLLTCVAMAATLLSVRPVTAAEQKPLSEWEDLAAVKKALKLAPQETAIFVGDMHCANCAKKVSRKLYAVKGVLKVRTDIKVDVAIVTPQQNKQLDSQSLWKAAQESGILPVKLIGPAGVMEADADGKREAQRPQEHASEPTVKR